MSAFTGLLPLLTIFIMLGVFRAKAFVAGLSALLVALVVSVASFTMPVGLAMLSATQGAVFGAFPIMWIVVCAIWVYQLSVISGRFRDLPIAFALISDDPRVQAIIIAFCFGGLLEALAGFGAPVAITGVMLIAMGFSAMRAACVVLLANTAPVAFGATAIPIVTASNLTRIPYTDIGSYVGRQTPVLAMVVPFLLIILVDGKRGLRQTWPVALVTGASFAIAEFVSANFISVEMTATIASLASFAATLGLLQVWQPVGSQTARNALRMEHESELRGIATTTVSAGGTVTLERTLERTVAPAEPTRRPGGGRILMAFMPYIIIISVFGLSKLSDPVKSYLIGTDKAIKWPGLDGHILTARGKPYPATIYYFQWLSSPGTMLLICGGIVVILYKINPVRAAAEFGSVLLKMRLAILTVASVLALAYVMNFSGQTTTIGLWIAGAGASFAFFSPVLGWLGTALTGSDTSANVLFSTLQQTVGRQTGISQTLLVAANSSGGVLGKMISPQSLTIAASATGLAGKEAYIFRKVILWSLGLLVLMCLLMGLQSTPVLSWMLGTGTLG